MPSSCTGNALGMRISEPHTTCHEPLLRTAGNEGPQGQSINGKADKSKTSERVILGNRWLLGEKRCVSQCKSLLKKIIRTMKQMGVVRDIQKMSTVHRQRNQNTFCRSARINSGNGETSTP